MVSFSLPWSALIRKRQCRVFLVPPVQPRLRNGIPESEAKHAKVSNAVSSFPLGRSANLLLVAFGFTSPNTSLEAVDVVNRVAEHLRDKSLPLFTGILVTADNKHAMDRLCALDVGSHPRFIILYDIATLVKGQRGGSIAELAVRESVSSSEVFPGKPFQLDKNKHQHQYIPGQI